MSDKKKTSPRLTEDDIHAACDELLSMGEEPTSLKLLDHIGHGGLATFTKYLATWKEKHKERQDEIAALPAVATLPADFIKTADDFNKKIYYLAKSLCDAEIEAERERLRQAEKEMKQKIEDGLAFSEKQSLRYDEIKAEFDELLEQHNELVPKFAALQQKYSDEQSKCAELQVELTNAVDQANKLAEIVSSFETKVALIEQEKEQLSKLVSERDETISDIKNGHKLAIEKLESKHSEELNRLMKSHEQALSEIKTVTNKALSDSETAHAAIVDQLKSTLAGLTKDKQDQAGQLKKIGDDLKTEQAEIKALRKKIDELNKPTAVKSDAKLEKKAVSDGEDKS